MSIPNSVSALAYYYRNRDERLKYNREWRKKNRSYVVAEALARRLKALAILGDKCVRCGFTDYRALQFDHKNGGGSRTRKTEYVVWNIIKGIDLDKYQILCANCNWIKRYELDENKNGRAFVEKAS